MNCITGVTKSGKVWTPQFLKAIDIEKCIGCGRCYKVCGRGVMALVEKPSHGDDAYGDDMGNMVMAVENPDECIGCEACARACAKKCHTHEPEVIRI